MAAAAAEEALKGAGIEGSEIDLILVATCSSDFSFPVLHVWCKSYPCYERGGV